MQYVATLDPVKVAKRAAELGLVISDGTDYYYDKNYKNNAIRLGFASLNTTELQEAVDILKRAITDVLG